MIKRLSLNWEQLLIIAPIAVLSTLSLVSLFAIHYNDERSANQQFNPWQQLLFVALGLILLLVISRTSIRHWERLAGWSYAASLVLLSGLAFLAEPMNGAKRWYEIGSFQFQPSEIAKLAVIILLARLLAKRAKRVRLSTILLSGLYASLPAVLVLLQPDLGTSVTFVAVWVAMLSVTPMKRAFLIGILLVGVFGTLVSLPHLADYQQKRLTTFLNPTVDPKGAGYNSRQAMIAIGSGQLTGRGLDGGTQSQLNFLPSQHTDFIFAVIAEKLGFIGAGLVIASLGTLCFGLLWKIRRASSLFAAYSGVGIVALLGFQALVNIGMNLGVLPVTGIPLPFVSYGGTHTIIGFFAVGLVMAASKGTKQLHFRT